MPHHPPIDPKELEKVPYLDVRAVAGRAVNLMPLWDGAKWRIWVISPPRVVELSGALVTGDYVSVSPIAEADLLIPFIDFMWQRASWTPISPYVSAISRDFHHMMASVAKLRHFHRARESMGSGLASEFAVCELEYLCTVARGVFDLLQAAISTLWSDFLAFHDPAMEARRKQKRLPETFSKVVLRDKQVPRSAAEIQTDFGLPPKTAAAYADAVPFFSLLRDTRDRIIHGTGRDPMVFCDDVGWCVSKDEQPFSRLSGWTDAHVLRNDLVSLLPWLAYVVLHTIDACDNVVMALNSEIEFPPPIAPGYRIYVRGVCSNEILDLRRVRESKLVWWKEPVVDPPHPGSGSER